MKTLPAWVRGVLLFAAVVLAIRAVYNVVGG